MITTESTENTEKGANPCIVLFSVSSVPSVVSVFESRRMIRHG
jgi:hypothetical protein